MNLSEFLCFLNFDVSYRVVQYLQFKIWGGGLSFQTSDATPITAANTTQLCTCNAAGRTCAAATNFAANTAAATNLQLSVRLPHLS